MALKAGSAKRPSEDDDSGFSNSLAEAIEDAMKKEWKAVKSVNLPNEGEQDRRLLFAAIAQGLFVFLKANEDALIKHITLEEVGISPSKNLKVNQLDLDL